MMTMIMMMMQSEGGMVKSRPDSGKASRYTAGNNNHKDHLRHDDYKYGDDYHAYNDDYGDNDNFGTQVDLTTKVRTFDSRQLMTKRKLKYFGVKI